MKPGVDFEIVLIGNDATIRGHCAGDFMPSIYAKHVAALKAGSHDDATTQGEFNHVGGRGLLCRVFEDQPAGP